LHTYDAFASDYVTATVIQQALGGHAIPIDKATHRVLDRLGISESDVPALRAILERAVPKNRGGEFVDLIEELANDTCLETDPECPRCELRKMCAYASARKQEAQSAAHSSRAAAARATKDAIKGTKAKAPEVTAPPAPKRKALPKSSKEATEPSKSPRAKQRGTK
jgi:adenine-specific DNA glycosylase